MVPREREADLATSRGACRLLTDLDEALLSAFDLEGTARALARFLAERVGDYAVMYLVGRDGQVGHVLASARDAERDVSLQAIVGIDRPDLDDPESLVADTTRHGQSTLIATMTDEDLARLATRAQLSAWQTLGCASSVVVPIPLRERVLGTIAICRSPGSPELTEDDLAFLRDVAERAAQAVENARLYRVRALVGDRAGAADVPAAAGAAGHPRRGAGRRVPTPPGQGLEVGGDFYDVFSTGEDQWYLVIGDVCGKGAEAAAVTALARYTLRRRRRARQRSPHAIL